MRSCTLSFHGQELSSTKEIFLCCFAAARQNAADEAAKGTPLACKIQEDLSDFSTEEDSKHFTQLLGFVVDCAACAIGRDSRDKLVDRFRTPLERCWIQGAMVSGTTA